MNLPPPTDHMVLRWVLLALLAVITLLWHWRQDRLLARHIPTADPLTRSLWNIARSRSLQTGALCLALLAVTISYDIHLLKQMDAPLAERPEALPAPEIDTPEITLEMAEEKLDHIKQDYEQAIVNYYFLNRCGHVTEADYTIIYAALMDALASLRAPPQWAERILQAAQGSYEGMYINSPCDGDTVAAIQAQFSLYLQDLRTAEAAKKADKP